MLLLLQANKSVLTLWEDFSVYRRETTKSECVRVQ